MIQTPLSEKDEDLQVEKVQCMYVHMWEPSYASLWAFVHYISATSNKDYIFILATLASLTSLLPSATSSEPSIDLADPEQSWNLGFHFAISNSTLKVHQNELYGYLCDIKGS